MYFTLHEKSPLTPLIHIKLWLRSKRSQRPPFPYLWLHIKGVKDHLCFTVNQSQLTCLSVWRLSKVRTKLLPIVTWTLSKLPLILCQSWTTCNSDARQMPVSKLVTQLCLAFDVNKKVHCSQRQLFVLIALNDVFEQHGNKNNWYRKIYSVQKYWRLTTAVV